MMRPRCIYSVGFAGGMPTARRLRAFTLTEMVVVIGIIVLLVAMVLPSVSTMWQSRKLADAEATIRGAVAVARRTAMSPDHGSAGLLFALDASGLQKIYLIEREDVNTDYVAPEDAVMMRLMSENRFVVKERVFDLPAPYRVVPRYAIFKAEDYPTAEHYKVFSNDELANNDFVAPPDSEDWHEAQRHRNYFSVVFSEEGQLVNGRDVLVADGKERFAGSGPFYGDRTGLRVVRAVTEYYDRASVKADDKRKIDSTGGGGALDWLVADNDDVAINFVSVDGFLLYDESLFGRMIDPENKREILMSQETIPLYMAGPSCSVVRGPRGENEVPE